MRTLFHVTTTHEWLEALASGQYRPRSLASEGFIHFSRPHQLLKTAERHFANATELKLLSIDEEPLIAELKYEGEPERFPHLYAPLNLRAVYAVDEFAKSFGSFHLPPYLQLIDGHLLRPGRMGDEAEIANVQTQAWLQSFTGLIEATALQARPLGFRTRMLWHRNILAGGGPGRCFVIESIEHGIVGFAIAGPQRGFAAFEGFGELHALFLLDQYKRLGLGRALLLQAARELREQGFDQMLAWTLVDNPAIEFYRAHGGKLTPHRQRRTVGGAECNELALRWDLTTQLL